MKQLLLFGFIIMCYIVAAGTALYYHEQAHYVIAYNHGCMDGSISYSVTSYSSFRCTSYMDVPKDMQLQERYLHAQNEITGYQQQAWIVFGFIMFSLWYVFKGDSI